MIISGYLYTKSFSKAQIHSLSQALIPSQLIPKLIRFAVPYTMVYLVEVIAHIFLSPKGIMEILLMYLAGGWGPGTYYIPFMFQFVFFVPFLYLLIERKGARGLLVCWISTFVYEFLQKAYGMNVECYTFIVLRYAFHIAFGCYLALYSLDSLQKFLRIGILLITVDKGYRYKLIGMTTISVEQIFIIAPGEGYGAVGKSTTPTVVTVGTMYHKPPHWIQLIGIFGRKIDAFHIMEETNHAAFISSFFQAFGYDTEHRTVDKDNIIRLCFTHYLANTLRSEAEIVAERHIEHSPHVFQQCAMMSLVVDKIGIHVALTYNLLQHMAVQLAGFLTALGHPKGFLIAYDQYLHSFFLR